VVKWLAGMSHGGMTDVTTEDTEDFAALYERVLRFMGAFSATQFAVDSAVGMYLRRRMPNLGAELDKQFLRRIRDDQRLPLFKAFAAEVGYEGDITHFGKIYNRAKQVRDLVGHSHSVIGPVYGGGEPVVGVASTLANVHLVPRPLMPSTFSRLTADCKWLSQHVWRAAYTADPDIFFDGSGKPTEPPIPAELPEGGAAANRSCSRLTRPIIRQPSVGAGMRTEGFSSMLTTSADSGPDHVKITIAYRSERFYSACMAMKSLCVV
jgi:hypothetical protein